MHWTVPGLPKERVQKLTDYFSQSSSETNSSGNTGSVHSNNPAVRLATTATNSDYGRLTNPSTSSSALTCPPRRKVPSKTSLSTRRARYLELCVNTGRYTRTLGEIDITAVDSDGELFEKIAEMYYRQRAGRGCFSVQLPWKMWQSSIWPICALVIPSSVIFRKVSCQTAFWKTYFEIMITADNPFIVVYAG